MVLRVFLGSKKNEKIVLKNMQETENSWTPKNIPCDAINR